MKIRYIWMLLAPFLLIAPLIGKSPAKPSPSPTPAVAPVNDHINPTAAWLMEQNGGKGAISLPLGEVLQTIAGHKILAFDATQPADRAFLAHLSEAMDRVLPRANKPDSQVNGALRRGERMSDVATRIEDDIALLFSQTRDFGSPSRLYYPSLRLMEGSDGKKYYLVVVLFPSGDRQEQARAMIIDRAFVIDPVEARAFVQSDGCCLFVGVEYNGPGGTGMGFVNWDVTDVSGIPVRAAITFDAGTADIYHPGAVLTDGRKGSD